MTKKRPRFISDGMATTPVPQGPESSSITPTEMRIYEQQDTLPRVLNKPQSAGLADDGIPQIIPPQHAPGLLATNQHVAQQNVTSGADQEIANVLSQRRQPPPQAYYENTSQLPQQEQEYDPSNLMGKLMKLQKKAGSSGKELKIAGGMKTKYYAARFLNILKMFSESTSMTAEHGPRGIKAYWVNDGIYTGIYCVHTNSPDNLSISTMSESGEEDNLKSIPLYDNLHDFDNEVEDFLCSLYDKYLDT